jgi:ATP-dependent exoDNAse (exonuclease V) beta subunit
MRGRIIAALAAAARGASAEGEHAQRTRELALAALACDRELGWNLTQNPARLQIQTIDALCMKLARRAPVLARYGAELTVTERARPLHRAAARMLLEEIEDAREGGRLAVLLEHVEGDERKLIELVADMLGERDRWLRHLAGSGRPELQRDALERGLAAIVGAELARVAAATPEWLARALPPIAAHAARAVQELDRGSPLLACRDLERMPDASPSALAAWLGIAELLLTAEGELRRQLRGEHGFGASAPASLRESLQALLARLAGESEFTRRLADLRRLPPVAYSDAQWRVCAALLGSLPRAAACLRLVFEEAGAVDFTEIAHAALRALGAPEAPTDLALVLDRRIEHLLVDEFQDTSFTQLDLLGRLTAGWQQDDGRSLFLVGDPMQSIYRFREAEVALFEQVERHGLGSLVLERLDLIRNFRAQAGLVEWVNSNFPRFFSRDDGSYGAPGVAFAPAAAVRARLDGPAVVLHPQADGDLSGEARAVVALVAAARAAAPDASIAVLVRAREHLAAIQPALRQAGLSYRAVDIEPLAHVPVVQDLHALTRALLHLGDRVAWLAILRAPWCGLTLADLHALTHGQDEQAVWESIVEERGRARLSEDGRRRLSRLKRALADSLAERGRHSLRRWIEGAWTALGGTACVRSDGEWASAQRYLRLLEEVDRGGEPGRLEDLDDALGELYADPDPAADDRLQLMTIHRAKGLEFDTVIVPGLGRAPGRGSERLLTVMERPRGTRAELVMAPTGGGGQADPIGRYLRHLDQRSEDEEGVRLLYVAATRARDRLHLLGAARAGTTGPGARRDSLLGLAWPALGASFPVQPLTARTDAAARNAGIRRLPSGWVLPQMPPHKGWRVVEAEEVAPEFAWASELARQVGVAVHRALDRIARNGVPHWEQLGEAGQRARLGSLLRELGTPRSRLDDGVERALAAIRSTLGDARGRWAIEGAHADARSEHDVAAWIDGRLVSATLDRTFVDEKGVRWIVDFKTGVHEGGNLREFLDAEVERYRPQMDRYAKIMRRLDDRPLRVGLYFPLLRAWREWEP